jgi:hypothetical protein
MYTGTSYSFYAQVDINTNEAIPITKLRLDISGPTSAWVEFSVDGSITSQSGHFTSITQVVSPFYGQGYGYGYGYGYDPSTGYGFITWGSYGYTDYGYGYGYGYSTGLSTQAKYLVTLNTSGMSTGSYQAQLACYVTPAPKRFLSSNYSFSISSRPAPVGDGEPAPRVRTVSPGVYDVSEVVSAAGVFRQDVTLESADDNVKLAIDRGTKGLTKEGRRLTRISITPMEEPPAPPEDASIIGLTYDIGPDGATFDPPITLTFTYDPDEIPEGVDEEDLVIALWDEAAGEWVELEDCVVDPVTHTITAPVSHFSKYAVIAYHIVPAPVVPPAPAAFSLSSLSVQPTEVQPKEAVTITVSVANTGGTEGAYTVVLKINGVKEAEKSVTIAAGRSKMVSFSVTREEAGSYSVTVDGLSASFIVVAPPVEKPPVEKPPVEKPPVEEVPAKPGINWGLIGGIIAAAVVIGGLLAYFLWWRRREA